MDPIQARGFVWFELLISASYLGAATNLAERVVARGRGSDEDRAGLAIELETMAAALEQVASAAAAADDNDALLARALYARFRDRTRRRARGHAGRRGPRRRAAGCRPSWPLRPGPRGSTPRWSGPRLSRQGQSLRQVFCGAAQIAPSLAAERQVVQRDENGQPLGRPTGGGQALGERPRRDVGISLGEPDLPEEVVYLGDGERQEIRGVPVVRPRPVPVVTQPVQRVLPGSCPAAGTAAGRRGSPVASSWRDCPYHQGALSLRPVEQRWRCCGEQGCIVGSEQHDAQSVGVAGGEVIRADGVLAAVWHLVLG